MEEVLLLNPFASVLFIGLGLVFLLLEIFIPSGGILGILASGCSLFGIFGFFYQHRPVVGTLAIVANIIFVVFAIRFGLWVLLTRGRRGWDFSDREARIRPEVGHTG